jgi:hypothetical protein
MRFVKLLLLAGAVAATAALSGSAAQAARDAPLVVFQEDNFGGDYREIREDQPDLGWIHFDDRISSVQVNRGVWELCQDSRYRGRCITVDHDIRKLDRLGFDDRTSSIRRIH